MIDVGTPRETNESIIYVDEKNNGLTTLRRVVGTGVSITDLKAELEEKLMKCIIPVARGLLKAIKSLSKKADIVRMGRIDEAFRLFHIELFGNVSIEKSGFDIKLDKLKIVSGSDGHYNANSFKFYYRRECFTVVNTYFLSVTLGN